MLAISLARKSGHDAVDKCGTHIVVLLKPCLEALAIGAEIILPEVDILDDGVAQMCPFSNISSRGIMMNPLSGAPLNVV